MELENSAGIVVIEHGESLPPSMQHRMRGRAQVTILAQPEWLGGTPAVFDFAWRELTP